MDCKVAVIIPVKNEGAAIDQLMESLLAQTLSPAEIVVTDGGSTDGTVERLMVWKERGLPLTVVLADHAFPGTGRNLAAEATECEILAFTDAGVRHHPDWMKRLLEPMEKDPEVDVVYGAFEPVTSSFYLRCAAYAHVKPKSLVEGIPTRTHFIASSLMKRKVWKEVGGFPDLRAGEDRIFMGRIRKAGRYKIAYAPRAMVQWEIPSSFGKTFRKYALYSRHDLIAGLARDWHLPVLRLYVLLAPVTVLGFIHKKTWFLGLPLFYVIRAAKNVWLKSETRRWLKVLNPLLVGGVALVLFTVDSAMFSGLFHWLWRDRFLSRFSPSRGTAKG
ncbi:glycosyltransferase [Nitrospinae bacterium AH_259_B05_G02_I21]|nr:glycosyltransferase [Nitrospinae bacterium AH_259_B05_G02_I21]MDA2931912.1 glycosyltransferase [Nitrospinae bacterium AH-259-F20]